MTEGANGKGKITRVIERTKPTLMTIGDRQVVSSGRWNDECMAQFVLANGRDKWLTIGEIARVAYMANTPRNKERARKCLASLFRHLMALGELLVIEYGPPHGRAMGVKLYAGGSEAEAQSMVSKLDRMRKRSELSTKSYEQAVALLDDKSKTEAA